MLLSSSFFPSYVVETGLRPILEEGNLFESEESAPTFVAAEQKDAEKKSDEESEEGEEKETKKAVVVKKSEEDGDELKGDRESLAQEISELLGQDVRLAGKHPLPHVFSA